MSVAKRNLARGAVSFAVALQKVAFRPENLRSYLGFETFCHGIRLFEGFGQGLI